MKKLILIFLPLCQLGLPLVKAQNVFPSSGNVGIGTATPTNLLDVRGGSIYTNGSVQVDGGNLYISRTNASYGYITRPNSAGYKNLCFAVAGGTALDNIQVNSTFSQFTGTVAIGAASSYGYQLAVNGSAVFTSAFVKPYGNWPDYVFRKDYRLPSLDSGARFVRTNKHLPDMPSAESVAKNGLDLGGNQAALLKKIEELTLYIIEQDKAQKEQQGQVKSMQERIDRLEKLIEQGGKK